MFPEDGKTSIKTQDYRGFDSKMPGPLVTVIAMEREDRSCLLQDVIGDTNGVVSSAKRRRPGTQDSSVSDTGQK